MKKVYTIRTLLVLPLWVALALLCAACGSTKSTTKPTTMPVIKPITKPTTPVQQVERDFYSEHSKKLGVQLQGTEHKELIRVSTQWLGTPYKYGGTSRSGIDCSAFVSVVYKDALGVTLPRTSSAIAQSAASVNRGDLQCGDIVYFTDKEKRISHVGIYLVNGSFVHASTSKGVSVANLSDSYWNTCYAGAGRVKGAIKAAPVKNTPPPKSETAENEKSEKPKAKEVEKTVTDDLIIVLDEEF